MGLKLLTKLTNGNVYLCQSPGEPLAKEDAHVICVSFSGTLAAGLPGTHIDRISPAHTDNGVWTIGYQDVAAIGHLFQSGRYRARRVLAIGGTAHSRLVFTSLGARIADLPDAEGARALSGNALSGREALYLGRYDDQVTLLPKTPSRPGHRWKNWLYPVGRALIPTRALEQALAVGIPPVPLLRALAVGDCEAAERLGCLALIEEDVAALGHCCTSGADYPFLLRKVLDDLMETAK